MKNNHSIRKAIFVIGNLQRCGAEIVVVTLCRALIKYHQYECHIILFENKIAIEVDANIKLHVMPCDVGNSFVSRQSRKNAGGHPKLAEKLDNYIKNNIGTIMDPSFKTTTH